MIGALSASTSKAGNSSDPAVCPFSFSVYVFDIINQGTEMKTFSVMLHYKYQNSLVLKLCS